MIACSKFDKNNQAHSSRQEIIESVASLLKYYDLRGQGYKLYLPLIGTGRSRVNLSNRESYELIIDTLIKNENYIHGEILMTLLPDVYEIIGEKNEL